jgi:hypothetical protein
MKYQVCLAVALHTTAVVAHSHTSMVAPMKALRIKGLGGHRHTLTGEGSYGSSNSNSNNIQEFTVLENGLSGGELPSKLKLKVPRVIASLQDSASNSQPSISTSSIASMLGNENIKLAFYMAVWYMGNIYYNLFNKYASNALGKDAHGHSNAHWVLSAVQVCILLLATTTTTTTTSYYY